MIAPEVECFILCGGHSSRFGSDKALAPLRGGTFLSSAIRAARGAGFTPRLVARRYSPYAEMGVPYVVSEAPDGGPVEGVRAACGSARATWVLLLAVDMPGVTSALLRAVLGAATQLEGEAHALGLEVGGRRHPFPGIYHRESVLAASPGVHSMQALLDALNAREWSDHGLAADTLRNVNRPEDAT